MVGPLTLMGLLLASPISGTHIYGGFLQDTLQFWCQHPKPHPPRPLLGHSLDLQVPRPPHSGNPSPCVSRAATSLKSRSTTKSEIKVKVQPPDTMWVVDQATSPVVESTYHVTLGRVWGLLRFNTRRIMSKDCCPSSSIFSQGIEGMGHPFLQTFRSIASCDCLMLSPPVIQVV